jgi:hypothetical protein
MERDNFVAPDYPHRRLGFRDRWHGDRTKTDLPGNAINENYLVALSPLLLLLVALVVVPIGLHYARLEREERARRDALNSKSTSPTT